MVIAKLPMRSAFSPAFMASCIATIALSYSFASTSDDTISNRAPSVFGSIASACRSDVTACFTWPAFSSSWPRCTQ